MKALVTGGAGYIGSHMVRTLVDEGHEVVVLDDLSAGHRDAVAREAHFVQGDVGDMELVRSILGERGIDAVLHFAGRIQVEESVSHPQRYYETNVVRSIRLLDAVVGSPVRAFVFSSTAAVYGNPDNVPIPESHPLRPVNPYGQTKLAIEAALAAYGHAYRLPWVALRYFNAAGAHPEAGLAERHDPETHLLPIVLEVAEGRRRSLNIYGHTWETPDGTCVRDFVHVRDLASAHLRAVDYLTAGGESGAFNLGTGQGHSVREVVAAAERVTGRSIATVDAPPRAGDPPILVASVAKAHEKLGWRAKRSDLGTIISDAWASRQIAT